MATFFGSRIRQGVTAVARKVASKSGMSRYTSGRALKTSRDARAGFRRKSNGGQGG